jgi:hypothetical protein
MRSRIVAAAIPCAVFAAAGMAQVYQAVKPQYYSYELNPPPTPGGWVHDDRFTSVIRIRLAEENSSLAANTPLHAAIQTATEIQQRHAGGRLACGPW